ncbi:MAG: ABC transporter substrate-binding protein [Proteobacteria bacterium]|nr:ABC transporter substrate-binding protein [Pseudomonadota bacterium]
MTALALTVSVAARAQAPSGEITLQAYAGIFQDNYVPAVVEPFMKKFPGVKVNYFQGGNSAQMLGNLRAQKSSPQIDVTIQDVSVQKIANDEGLYAELDPAELPNLNDLAPMARVAGKLGPAVTFDHFTVIYAKETVQPPPTGLKDLWDPKNKGLLAFAAAPDIIGLSLTILTNKMEGGDYKQSIDAGVKKLRDLAPLVQTFDPQPDNYTLIINGTARMGVAWNARSQLYSDLSKGKLGVVLPAEGSAFQINTINLTAGSKNPAAAKAFINYAISPEAQKAFTERMFYAPVNAKTQVSPEALARTAAAPENMAKMVAIDWVYVSTVRDRWNDRWRREIIAASR